MKRIQFIGIILIMWTATFSVQNLADLSSEDWREDIEYLEERLISIHPNPFFRIDRGVFQASIEALEQGLDELSWYEIYTRLTEIVASIGDGHTVVYPQGSSTLYPIYTYWFSDGLYVIATSESEQRLLNSKVLEISGMKVDDALKALRRVVSHDNEWGFMNSHSDYLNKPEIMMGLGLADKEGNLLLKIENNGVVNEVLVEPQNTGFQWVQKRIEEIDRTYIGRKYWYQYYPDSKILHFHYASCGSEKGNPFIFFNFEMFLFTWTNAVDKFVIDLRGNGGGSSVILEPFILRMMIDWRLNRTGKFFVLIDRGTFSSAVLNAISLKKRTNAIFVGEPTGGSPRHYGEVKRFVLPNSGISVSCSSTYWRTTSDTSPAFMPDIIAIRSFEDYYYMRDLAMEAVEFYRIEKEE
ncbi:S41 family peptidase [Mesotoga sp. H07.pep.5.3]|uniref:S41 family peptidase n=1 Tax=Mesotoga sp. H07.pep.5.3 TaxID=1421003 RepID=UPI000C18D8A7|nr:S41 family peptidase [Mesotoga sp. H07.pep.5.3]PIJ60737.1 peptidase [Mesotoga sp. H07.pep.5.3]